MILQDKPQEHVQAIRSVDKSIRPNAVTPATPDEIYYVDTHPDPETQKEIVLWDDILQAFDNAVQVRHRARVVPFLKGRDFTILLPRRIAAMPDIVLDVIVDTPATDSGIATPQVQQLNPLPVPPPTYESTLGAGFTSSLNSPSTSRTSSTRRAAPAATSTARSTSVDDLDETLMANLSLHNRPLTSPQARYRHAVLDDQAPTTEDLPVRSRPNSDNGSRRVLQCASTNLSVEMNWAQAIISASYGDRGAEAALGDMYRDGKGVEQDYQTAMEWYLKAADQGHTGSQYNIGEFYYFGQGVRQDYTQALNWYLKAASQGHALSQYSIGVLYDKGEGVPQDYAKAIEWYLKAANRGYAVAQNSIGFFYYRGRGVPQDFAQAMEWFVKSAEQENEDAQFNIGKLYCQGEGVPQDVTKGVEWFSKAAERGHVGAQGALILLERIGVTVN